MAILLLGFSLLMMLLGKEEEELGRMDDDCVSLLILKALFVAPLIDDCCIVGRKMLLFGCDSLSNALGFSLIASSYLGGLDVT